jgi:subtilisin-like proprotein convertase family protein
MRTAHRLALLLAALAAASPAAAQNQVISTGPGLNIAIPDGTYKGTRATMGCSTLDIPSTVAGKVSDLSVSVLIDHTYVSDLTMKLYSPAGREVTLLSRPGIDELTDDGSTPPGEAGYSANLSVSYLITFFDGSPNDAERMGEGLRDDQAVGNFMIQSPGLYRPAAGAAGGSTLGVFRGESPVGRWTLCVGDALAGDSGVIDFWQMTVRATTNPCVSGGQTLCLTREAGAAEGRFRVTATWEAPDGTRGSGQAVPLTPDTGYFWFFSQTNVEVVVKVLNACSAPFNRFWVFAGGLTNVEVEVVVEDTKTGERRAYFNPQRSAFRPVQDTDAFATCP